MKKDRDIEYYYTRLQKRSSEILAEMTEGCSDEDIVAMEEELEYRTFLPAMVGRIGQHLGFARALVDALPRSSDEPSMITYMVVDPPWDYGKFANASLNRAEILQKLRDISSDDFGDDPSEWLAWIEAWEEENPPVRYR